MRKLRAFGVPRISRIHSTASEPGSVVDIATDYGAWRSGDRIPVGTRFSATVQTGPGAHPASCTMGTGSFPGGKKRPGRDADPSLPSNTVVKKE